MNPGRLKVGAALLLTSAFVPLLFQGEEWAASSSFLFFTDHRDPKLAEAVRTGRRREFAAFGWKPEAVPDPQERGTFLRSRLNWSEPASEPHRSVLEWYRRLLWLRRQEPSLANGTLAGMATHFDEQARWLVVERGPLSVACNLASQPLEVPLRTQSHQVLLASAPLSDVVHSQVTLPADSAAILNLAKI